MKGGGGGGGLRRILWSLFMEVAKERGTENDGCRKWREKGG